MPDVCFSITYLPHPLSQAHHTAEHRKGVLEALTSKHKVMLPDVVDADRLLVVVGIQHHAAPGQVVELRAEHDWHRIVRLQACCKCHGVLPCRTMSVGEQGQRWPEVCLADPVAQQTRIPSFRMLRLHLSCTGAGMESRLWCGPSDSA